MVRRTGEAAERWVGDVSSVLQVLCEGDIRRDDTAGSDDEQMYQCVEWTAVLPIFNSCSFMDIVK